MLLELDPWTAGHLAAAVRAHRERLRRQHFEYPRELEEIERAATERARTSQAASVIAEAAMSAHDEPMSMLLTKEATARALSVSPRTVDRLIASGALATVPLGRSRRISREALEAFVASREQAA